jgi:hypothetical protein
MIINKSFNICENTCIPIPYEILLVLNFGSLKREVSNKNEWHNKKSLDPFYKFISTMRFQMIFYAISRSHFKFSLSEEKWWGNLAYRVVMLEEYAMQRSEPSCGG